MNHIYCNRKDNKNKLIMKFKICRNKVLQNLPQDFKLNKILQLKDFLQSSGHFQKIEKNKITNNFIKQIIIK